MGNFVMGQQRQVNRDATQALQSGCIPGYGLESSPCAAPCICGCAPRPSAQPLHTWSMCIMMAPDNQVRGGWPCPVAAAWRSSQSVTTSMRLIHALPPTSAVHGHTTGRCNRDVLIPDQQPKWVYHCIYTRAICVRMHRLCTAVRGKVHTQSTSAGTCQP